MARVTPTVIGYAVAAATTGNSLTFNKSDLPALVNGDYLAAFLRSSTSSVSADYACTGFTRLTEAITVDSSGRLIGSYGHVVTTASSEPSTWTFTFTGTGGRNSGVLVLVRDVDTTTPVSGHGPVGNSPTYYSTATFPTTAGSLILVAAANEVVSPNSSTPTTVDADYTTVATQPSTTGTGATRTLVWVGQAVAGTTTAPSAQGTVWASSSSLAYWGISLQGVDVTETSGLLIKLGDGTAARMTVLVGATRVNPLSAKMWLPGFSTVTAALAKPGATMGHRGASSTPNMPEMSERSYDYTVMRGYGILEFSAAKTTDGVWYGMHDQTFDRTSQISTAVNGNSVSWATVQSTYQNTLNSGGTPRPYYRMIDFLDKYTPTHVVMCDPKYGIGGPDVNDFLDTLDAHGGPTKIVVKYAGGTAGGANLSDLAIARGYQTWGYFYDVDYSDGDLALYASRFTILGMEWNASGAAWTAVNSYGKLVIGHVCATQSAYATAISNGADLVQCSRPDLISPVSVWT